MFCSRFGRGAGLWACVVVLAAVVADGQVPDPRNSPPPTFFAPPGSAAVAQDAPEVRGRRQGRLYPPPTFLTPPGGPTSGAIIMQPPIPPGNMPRVIWQSGGQPHEVVKPSDHWVGVQCGRMSPALRAQLGLDEEQGVLVVAVVDDCPAAKAGIEKYDVLVQAGDRKLTKVQDLIDEVDAVKDGRLSIELIRKAKKKTVQVTPEKRPPIEALSDESAQDSPGEWKNFFDYMQQWEPGKDGRPSMKLRFWHPGTTVPGQTKSAEKLPGNVKIQIRKQGDGPAEIEVTRGDETWSVTHDEIGKLPDDLRPHVERMLGRPHGPAGRQVFTPQGFKIPSPLESREGLIEKQFEDMNRRFDRLQKTIEELRENRREKSKPEKKTEPEPEATKLKPSTTEA